MVNRPKLEILKREYGITDKKLEQLGIIAPERKTISIMLNKDEYEKLTELGYSMEMYKSEILRKIVAGLLSGNLDSQKLIKSGREYVKKNISTKDLRKTMTFKLDKDSFNKLKKTCRQNRISMSGILRFGILYETGLIII